MQIFIDGVIVKFFFEIFLFGGLLMIGGVWIYLMFSQDNLLVFYFCLVIGGENYMIFQSVGGLMSKMYVVQFLELLSVLQQVELWLNEGIMFQLGCVIIVYVWGVQMESGMGVLNFDEGGEFSLMIDIIELGIVEVIIWQEWNWIIGVNEGFEGFQLFGFCVGR